MRNITSRSQLLSSRINNHLSKITKVDKDYYSSLNHTEILQLKSVLSDIHNVLTFKMTIVSAKWLFDYFEIPIYEQQKVLNKIDNTSPNASGFDIVIEEPYKILAEVKCIDPVKQGEKFGAAQRNSILNDFEKLLTGKRSISNTTEYYKFLFLIDLGERSTKALDQLLVETKLRVDSEIRKRRNEVRKEVKILKEESVNSLTKNTVYAKVIELQ